MVSCRRMFFGLCIRPRQVSKKIVLYTSIIVFIFTLFVLNDSREQINKVSVDVTNREFERKDIDKHHLDNEEIDFNSPEKEREEEENHQKRNLNYYNDDSYKQEDTNRNVQSSYDAKQSQNVAGYRFSDTDKAFDVNGNYKRKFKKRYEPLVNRNGDMQLLVKKHVQNKDYLQRKNTYLNTDNNAGSNLLNWKKHIQRSDKNSFNHNNYVLENHLPQKKEMGDDDELKNVYIVKNSSQKTTISITRKTTTAAPNINQHIRRLSAKDKRKDIRKCNKVRMQRLHNRCRDLDIEPMDKRTDSEIIDIARKIITDDKHRVLINALPKTGCSSWKMVMLNNSGYSIDKPGQRPSKGINNWEILNAYGLKDLGEFSIDHIRYRLKYYYSILTVRHPFERLESAFREKFTKTNKYYKDKMGAKIIEKYRNNVNELDETQDNNNVTFEEFVRFSLEQNNTDRHWMPIWDLAHPCVLPYQYVAKTETASRDMDYIAATKLSHGVSGGGYQYNPTQTEEQVQIKSAKILPLFSQLSPTVQEELLLRTLERYMDDMELFGYRIRREAGNVIADCEMYSPEGMCC